MDTEKKDLIGIVKELQAMRAYGIEHVHDDTRVSARNVPEVEWLYWHRLEKEFPNIAQALLIAVEGLEWFEQCEAQLWGDSQEAKLKAEIINELALKPVNNKAKEILSRIRSLPTQ